jgi:8-oxo-dGTP pyrophosphatase MutT (NUDIX family)
MQPILYRLQPFTRPVLAFIALIIRPMTLGVRVIVRDEMGRILLVRHSYEAGWMLPGGGVDAGETMQTAALRELREECALVGQDARLLGIYQNRHFSRRDHVGLFRISSFTPASTAWKPNAEIREIGFFPLDALPGNTTTATQLRIAEVFFGAEPGQFW